MRKIQTQAEINRKKKKNQIILGVILIGVMVLSTLGYSISDNFGSSKKMEFNGFKFQKNNNYWNLDLSGQQFVFRNLPQNVSDVSVFGFYDLNSYADKTLYFVNLGKSNEAGQEILTNLGRYILRWQEACLDLSSSELECSADLPVKSCDENLIIFENGANNITKVYKDDNCVHISGDLISGSDAFLYKLLGILQ